MKLIDKVGPITEMRALSWKQPFASLMLHGKVETRTWDTKYKGWVLICASKQPYNYDTTKSISGYDQYLRIYDTLKVGGAKGLWPTFGKAIAVGYLHSTRIMAVYDDNPATISIRENDCFVQYNSSLWMHEYRDVMPIKPFAWKGAQGWRKLDQELINSIELL